LICANNALTKQKNIQFISVNKFDKMRIWTLEH